MLDVLAACPGSAARRALGTGGIRLAPSTLVSRSSDRCVPPPSASSVGTAARRTVWLLTCRCSGCERPVGVGVEALILHHFPSSGGTSASIGSQNSIDRTGPTVPSRCVARHGSSRSTSGRSPCRRSAMRLYWRTWDRVARRRPGRSYDQPRGSARHRGRAQPEPERAWPAAVADRAAAAAGTPVTETRTSSGTSSTPPWSSTSSSPWMRSSPLTGHGSFGIDLTASCCWAILLWLNTLSCRACRHAVGGRINGASTTFPPTRSETDSGLWLPRSTRTTATSPGPR
jgi:hypothetical protein